MTAVNIIGHSECEAVINAECIYKLMKLAGTEESIGVETLDDYAVQKIIGWFQQQEDIDLELRSDIEFIYLPMLDEYSEVRPRALNTRLSLARLWAKWFMEKQKNKYQKEIEGYKNELAVELAKCRTLNEKILHKEIFIYDEEFKIYKEIMPGFRKASKSVLDYLVIIKLLVEKGIEDTTEGKEKIQKAYASAYEMTFAYYDLVMDEGIFIEEQTYVMLMNFFAHCEKILRINLNPENWKDMKWDEIIDNQINEENKITCHLRNKIRSC